MQRNHWNWKWKRVPCILLGFVLISISHRANAVTNTAMLDLNTWLEDFENCYTNVILLESDLELTPFIYPVTMYSTDSVLRGALLHPKFQRHVFCSTQVFALSKLKTLQDSKFIMTAFESYYGGDERCSVPASRNPTELNWTYSHCTVIVAGLRKEYWETYKLITPYKDNPGHILYNLHFDQRANEYFFLFMDELGGPSELEMIYLCRLCNSSFNISEFVIPCQNGVGCRNAIEHVVHQATQDGRTIVPRFPVESFYDTEEENLSFLFTSSSFEALSYLRNITLRSYWKNTKIPFTKLIQGILFETVVKGEAEELILAMKEYSELLKYLIDRHLIYYSAYGRVISDYSNLYITGNAFFNFVTCHGLEEDSSVKAYLGPFDAGTWSMVLLILLATPVTLVITLFVLTKGRIYFVNTLLQKISNTCFYVGSMVLDNGSSSYLPKTPGTGAGTIIKFAFCTLSAISVILGNSYKGVLTRNIIYPPPSHISVEYIHELTNFSLVVLPLKHLVEKHKDLLDEILDRYQRKRQMGGKSMSTFSKQVYVLVQQDFYSSVYKRIIVHPDVFKARASASECDKTAFVGLPEEIDEFMAFPESEASFAYGKDKFLPSKRHWVIPVVAGRYYNHRMASIISSGIHQMWEKIYTLSTNAARIKSSGKPKVVAINRKQGLKGKLAALFRFVIAGFAILMCVFTLEVLIGNSENRHLLISRFRSEYLP